MSSIDSPAPLLDFDELCLEMCTPASGSLGRQMNVGPAHKVRIQNGAAIEMFGDQYNSRELDSTEVRMLISDAVKLARHRTAPVRRADRGAN